MAQTVIETTTIQFIGVLTIPNGQAVSNSLIADLYGMYSAILIFGPAALTNTVTVQSGGDDSVGATFQAVQSPPGTDITVPAAKAIVLTAFPFPQFRVGSSGNEGATRTFQIWGQRSAIVNR